MAQKTSAAAKVPDARRRGRPPRNCRSFPIFSALKLILLVEALGAIDRTTESVARRAESGGSPGHWAVTSRTAAR
jgi:hypothetical protein